MIYHMLDSLIGQPSIGDLQVGKSPRLEGYCRKPVSSTNMHDAIIYCELDRLFFNLSNSLIVYEDYSQSIVCIKLNHTRLRASTDSRYNHVEVHGLSSVRNDLWIRAYSVRGRKPSGHYGSVQVEGFSHACDILDRVCNQCTCDRSL